MMMGFSTSDAEYILHEKENRIGVEVKIGGKMDDLRGVYESKASSLGVFDVDNPDRIQSKNLTYF